MGLAARVITVSDRCTRGEAEDRSGPLALSLLAGHGISADLVLVPDDIPAIRAAIRSACEAGARLVFTTGGITQYATALIGGIMPLCATCVS